jgi:hypothetical protein
MSKPSVEPTIVEDADQARELDYSYAVLDRVLLLGGAKFVLVALLMVYLHLSVLFAGLVGLAGVASTVLLRRHFGRVRRERLSRFLHPATGELSVPGGPRQVTWGDLLAASLGRRS